MKTPTLQNIHLRLVRELIEVARSGTALMLQIPKGNDLAVTAQGRIATLDRARTVITLLVVLHHSVIKRYWLFIPIDTRRQKTMTRFKIFSTAAILSLMFATPVFAFYYPNNDVLNGGRPTPAARMDAMAGLGPFSGSYAYAATDSTANGASCAQRYRSYVPASGTFLGYGGRRHKCE